MRALSYVAICALGLCPGAAIAQAAAISCSLTVVCVETGPCSDWGQDLILRETPEAWQIEWVGDRVADYTLVADIPAPDGALAPTRLRSFFRADPVTQSVQYVSLADDGNVTVTIAQPHIRPRSVTGFGTCRTGGLQ